MKSIKKIIKSFKKFFLSIWKFIDKFIVVPVTKFFLGITNILNTPINAGIYITSSLPIKFSDLMIK